MFVLYLFRIIIINNNNDVLLWPSGRSRLVSGISLYRSKGSLYCRGQNNKNYYYNITKSIGNRVQLQINNTDY